MKKLRMIVTSVIVLAIVGSAFAFKAKQGAFCVVASSTATDCTTYIQNVKTVTINGTQYKYAPFWDGDPVACTTTSNGLCTGSLIRFGADQ
jgi:hypothetical protein